MFFSDWSPSSGWFGDDARLASYGAELRWHLQAVPARIGGERIVPREFRSAFWDDLEADLEDPAFRDAYTQSTAEIAAIDRAENERRDSEAKETSVSD